MDSEPSREQQYKYVLAQLKSFYKKYDEAEFKLSREARMTSIVSLVKNHIPGLFFVGFYVVVKVIDLNGQVTDQEYIEVGPYQSTILATPRIAFGKGQCGQAWQEQKTQLVNDVSTCKNYIACDDETQSEIVVPVFDGDRCIAVLDIDSDKKDWFSDVDRKYLEEIVTFVSK